MADEKVYTQARRQTHTRLLAQRFIGQPVFFRLSDGRQIELGAIADCYSNYGLPSVSLVTFVLNNGHRFRDLRGNTAFTISPKAIKASDQQPNVPRWRQQYELDFGNGE